MLRGSRSVGVYAVCARRQFTCVLARLKPFDLGLLKTNNNPSETFNFESMNRFGDSSATSRPVKENRFAQRFEKSAPKKNNHPKRQEKHRNPRKAVRFQFESGSVQAQNALKAVINEVHSYSKSYKVNYVGSGKGGLEQKHLVDIVNNLDLAVNGIYCVPPTNDKSLPILKVNKVQEMIKSYTDKLALEKEQELLQKGSIVAQKVMRLRDRAEKKKSATKVLTVSWGISNSDLCNQKATEIQKRVSKGEHFLLYLGEKKSFYSARQLAGKENAFGLKDTPDVGEIAEEDLAEMSVEERKRVSIFQTVKTMLDDISCQYEISGDLKSRVLFSCQPLERDTKPKDMEQKETKKTKKASATKQNEESKKALSEDELDSLYLFKIED